MWSGECWAWFWSVWFEFILRILSPPRWSFLKTLGHLWSPFRTRTDPAGNLTASCGVAAEETGPLKPNSMLCGQGYVFRIDLAGTTTAGRMLGLLSDWLIVLSVSS